MRVNEAGDNRFASEVYLDCSCGRKLSYLIVRADGEEASIGNGDGLGAWLAVVNGDDIAVVENGLGRSAFARD